nr:hypothetical protein Iba_scaffold5809CG0020 [Ipomoea batatas]
MCLLMDHCDQTKQCYKGRTCLGHTAKGRNCHAKQPR